MQQHWHKIGMLRVLSIILCLSIVGSAQAKVVVFAAASMGEVIGKIAKKFELKTGIEVVGSFAGTGQLARQIEAGAPADIFISADDDWVSWLETLGLISNNRTAVIAGNRLVVAVRNETENWADVPAMLAGGRFSMGDPSSVPAGKYAKQALQTMGLWQKAKRNAVFGENVRLALKRVELGEVEAAVVYESDVRQSSKTRTGLVFRSEAHDKILYRAAPVKASKNAEEVNALLTFLVGDAAKQVFSQAGFSDAK